MAPTEVDVCVIGGGQSGLATGYHLRRRTQLSFVVLDDHRRPGGAWQEMWPSLHLFSPASYSSLPGWPMPAWDGEDNPDAEHVAGYLAAYEERYDLPVLRPVLVRAVRDGGHGRLLVEAEDGRSWAARAVVNATGTWRRPFWPHVPGMRDFRGRQLHTAGYPGPEPFAGQRVLVVGGGNSGAQIAADLLPVAEVTWATQRPPRMLPDDVDGRVLFETATRAVRARAAGEEHEGVGGLGDIVAVPSVRHARDHLGLHAEPMLDRLDADGAVWADGTRRSFDAVVWCTGFRPALRHLAPLHRPEHRNGDGLYFVGYGDWSGPASATLIGVHRSARDVVAAIAEEAQASIWSTSTS